MLSKNLIVLPIEMAFEADPWDVLADFHSQTARILSKKNIVVILTNKRNITLKELLFSRFRHRIFRKVHSNIFSYEGIDVLPFVRFSFIRKINKYLELKILILCLYIFSRKNSCKHFIIWIFEPQFSYLVKAFRNFFTCISVYDCVDYWRNGDTGENLKRIDQQEKYLLTFSDVVVVNSHALYDINSKKCDGPIRLVPQGFRAQEFSGSRFSKFKKFNKYKKDITLGFLGAISNRIDFSLLYNLAKRNSNWKFVLVGQKNDYQNKHLKKLAQLKNVSLVKAVGKSEIPKVINEFDITMIPYKIAKRSNIHRFPYDFNRYCFPMKLFEYFYMGKPVIATPIEELKLFPNLVMIGNSAKEWEKLINTIIKNGWSQSKQIAQRELSELNSWKKKIIAISEEIEKKFV